MPLINEVKIIPCSFRHIIPVRFALCTHTDCTIPDNVLKAFKPGANLPEVNHAYTLRTLDSGYVLATWNSNPTEENIAVFAAKGGRLTMLDGPRSTGFASRPDTIAVPREVSQLYMLFIRIPKSEEEFPSERDKEVWKEMRRNLAADPYEQMQLVTLGKAVNPGLRQYSYEASPTCFHADDLPNHVEEYAEEPGCLLRLRQEGAGVNLFEERKPAESKEWSPQELCGRLSPWKRWDASASPFSAKPLPESTHHDTHVACLADPVGMIYDMVAAYSAGLEDLSLYARWHEPMIVSGELTRLYAESKGRKDNRVIKPPVRPGDCHYEPEQPRAAFLPDLAPYNNFKRSHSEALEYLEDRLNFITGSWQALVQDTRPIYSFQFQLGNFFLSDDQKKPYPVDPATAFNSDEIPADPLTVARLAILAGAFHNIAARLPSFVVLDGLFSQGSPFLGLFERIVGEGSVPGNEYGLLLTQLTSYMADRSKKAGTAARVQPIITAFNRRLGFPPAEPSRTLADGSFAAQVWVNSEFYPIPGEAETADDSAVKKTFDTLHSVVGAFTMPLEIFLKKEFDKLKTAKNQCEIAEREYRSASLGIGKLRKEEAFWAAKVKRAQANLKEAEKGSQRAWSDYLISKTRYAPALDAEKLRLKQAEQSFASAKAGWNNAKDALTRATLDPLGSGKQMRQIEREIQQAKTALISARTELIHSYERHTGAMGMPLRSSDLRVSTHAKIQQKRDRIKSLREEQAQAWQALALSDSMEQKALSDLQENILTWRQSYELRTSTKIERAIARTGFDQTQINHIQTEARFHFVTSLGRAVNALDGCMSGINLIMTAFQLTDELKSARKDLAPFLRDVASVTADGLVVLEMALAKRVRIHSFRLLTVLFHQITGLALGLVMDTLDVFKLMRNKDFDAAAVTFMGGLATFALGAVAVTTSSLLCGAGAFIAGMGTPLAADLFKDDTLETAAKNNYWADASTRKILDSSPIFDPFGKTIVFSSPQEQEAKAAWKDFFAHVHKDVGALYSPRIEMGLAAGNRLQVVTSCISGAILGPVAAGVGVIVRNASGTGGVTVDLDGGQLAREPQDYTVDGIQKTVLEFDVAKILLLVKDRLEKTPGPGDYSIALPSAVFHMFNDDMELFSSARSFLDVSLQRDVTAEDFSENDIAQTQGNFS
ncbi:hypothetical protein H4684_002660 [Desulfomicrobium macestii]|uniref:Uncharacterized protein n=1 Tax=Desulfomicrobium macestii TaxID=90731 RepID=A0ABR9H5M4_9BACT|nr:hypothetical protein [Desulfomicrobium macestii]MBE1426001.1 hypothetical protein [Desulfomicrobium macestii]